jgi:hypothetical protein
LGKYLKEEIFSDKSEDFRLIEIKNPWFTFENVKYSLNAWQKHLKRDLLEAWINPYKLKEVTNPKKVLVIMAGNIPLVGFHDFLSVLISGHKVVVKMSSSDNILMKIIIEKLVKIAPEFDNLILFIDDIKSNNFSAVIATGSDNSAKYFEYYFRDAKRIIRKNRRSIAVLDGTESENELEGLSVDIFSYFGLGCRNVSKLFLPNGYNLNKLFQVFFNYRDLANHKKYANNYDYNKAIFLMGSNKLIENGFLLMKEDKSLFSPVAMLFYEFYDDIIDVNSFVEHNASKLQCVVSKNNTPFGCAQKPNLWDYSDGVDTIDFLRGL